MTRKSRMAIDGAAKSQATDAARTDSEGTPSPALHSNERCVQLEVRDNYEDASHDEAHLAL